MDKHQAINDIQSIFRHFKALTPGDLALLSGLNHGKLYELYVLSEVLLDLQRRGFQFRFVGNTLKFKAAPGKIKLNAPHFVVTAPNGKQLWLFVDIEFQTLGNSRSHTTDLSGYHELDLVLVKTKPDYPSYDQILLAVECKCVANFSKKLVREALGIRRELSLLTTCQNSLLTNIGGHPPVEVPAEPASEFWLAFIDEAGTKYEQSPAAFGINLKHIEP